MSTDLLDPMHELHPHRNGSAACEAFAWIDLIGMARWRDGGGLVRGQLSVSQSFLATRWNWNRSRVQRFLADLEAAGRITKEQRASREPDIINVCNYEVYNDPRTTNEPRTNDEKDRERVREKDGERVTSSTSTSRTTPTKPSRENRKSKDPIELARELWEEPDPYASAVATVGASEGPGDLIRGLVAAWIVKNYTADDEPGYALISGQEGAAKSLATTYEPKDAADMLLGIGNLYSFDYTWNLHTFIGPGGDKKAADAAAKGREIRTRVESRRKESIDYEAIARRRIDEIDRRANEKLGDRDPREAASEAIADLARGMRA